MNACKDCKDSLSLVSGVVICKKNGDLRNREQTCPSYKRVWWKFWVQK